MISLPRWMRWTLFGTTIYNAFGVVLFIPLLAFGRKLVGIPGAHPFYLWLVTIWIGSFGVLYVWLGVTGRPDRAFLIIAAIGKFSFFSLMLSYWVAGDFPGIAPVVASGDLICSLLFTYWLWKNPDS